MASCANRDDFDIMHIPRPPRLSVARREAHFGGFLIYMTNTYTKPCLSESQQVTLLESRGLVVADRESAAQFLSRVNYYRLSGYAIPFLIDREHFMPGAVWGDLVAVCRYDRELRDLLFEALEAAELAYRAILARKLSEVTGPLGYRDAANFRNSSVFAVQLRHFDKTIADSTERCIVHFKNNYGNDQVPIWALVEVETFGPVTKLYENARAIVQSEIAKAYGIGAAPLRSYLQHLRVLRNFCAHHARLIGRRFYGYRPFVDWPQAAATTDTRKLFHQFLFAYRMLKGIPTVCFDRDDWKRRVCDTLDRVPQSPCFDLAALMGVPSDAATSPLWE